MRIKLLKPWKHHLEGTILDIPGGQADVMIRRHIAKKLVVRGRPPSALDKMLRMQSKIRDSNQEVVTK